MKILKITNRLLRVMGIAEYETELSKSKVLTPIHLLMDFLQEKTGVLGEIALKCTLDVDTLREQIEHTVNQSIQIPLFDVNINKEVEEIFNVAMDHMKRYNQIYLNEGHVLKALIKGKFIDKFLNDYNTEVLLTLGTTSRDMITHLGDYTFPIIENDTVRKVTHNDFAKLIKYAEHNFSYEWSQTLKEGFQFKNIYIAVNNEEQIVGFSAYDIYQNKKCYFGLMGVSQSPRQSGIGYSSLHHCLRDMKDIGYEYAIIGDAGPIEFYEKSCNAVVIPLK